MLKKVVEGLRPVIARADPGLGCAVRPEGRRRTSVLQDALGPRALFRASNQSTSGLFRRFFSTLLELEGGVDRCWAGIKANCGVLTSSLTGPWWRTGALTLRDPAPAAGR